MSAAAVKLGLAAEDNAEELKDLDEARKLITALAGLVTAAAPEIGSQHAGPLRDGLRSLQLAFREESHHSGRARQGPGREVHRRQSTRRTVPRTASDGGPTFKGSPAVVL